MQWQTAFWSSCHTKYCRVSSFLSGNCNKDEATFFWCGCQMRRQVHCQPTAILAMTVKSTIPEEMKGEAMHRVAQCFSMPLAQLAHSRDPLASASLSQRMLAVIRRRRQATHEGQLQQKGSSCIKPGPIRKLPEDDSGRDALSELAELTAESHLNSQQVLELWS